jgi:hypothetical protein
VAFLIFCFLSIEGMCVQHGHRNYEMLYLAKSRARKPYPSGPSRFPALLRAQRPGVALLCAVVGPPGPNRESWRAVLRRASTPAGGRFRRPCRPAPARAKPRLSTCRSIQNPTARRAMPNTPALFDCLPRSLAVGAPSASRFQCRYFPHLELLPPRVHCFRAIIRTSRDPGPPQSPIPSSSSYRSIWKSLK